MTEKDKKQQYKLFQQRCLMNAEAALASAKQLAAPQTNHIAFHLAILALEEIGKIFVGHYLLFTAMDENGDREMNLTIDDHVKKLFWAIWGPTLGQEIVTTEQFQDNQRLATRLHARRLDSLYVSLEDETLPSMKIVDDELTQILGYTEGRLALAKHEKLHIADGQMPADLQWFQIQCEKEERISFILGKESQEKLIELGNVKSWITWLRNYFEQQEREHNDLFQKEINRKPGDIDGPVKPKWKMVIKINTPSHSIRAKDLNAVNDPRDIVKLNKGAGNHTLIIELTIGDYVAIDSLWDYGWVLSKLYVAALNIGSNGFFYWNANIDTETYYESLKDLEHNKQLKVSLNSGLVINWAERKAVLTELNLQVTRIVYRYLMKFNNGPLKRVFNLYLAGIALLAKSDIHSRFEELIFTEFYEAFKISITVSLNLKEGDDFIEFGYQQLKHMIIDRSEFDRILHLGKAMEGQAIKPGTKISLPDVILMKQYCGFYIMTLAIRYEHGNDKLLLVINELGL